ncbi:MAG: Trp family transcriptional regulator [Candidatus Curtissbacteria bacterium]|nr:Trp family transcriptional regulator [Candidatus Curtissbacteria bacterium]
MSQVSRRQLTKEIENKVFDSFWSVMANLKKKKEVSIFFSDFFTKTEKVNFAKRMSIAILLYKGYDYRSIRDILKVSVDTIGRVSSNIEDDGWRLFLKKLEQIEGWQKFWHDMELVLLRFTGGGRRAFKSDEELEAIIRSRKSRK